MYKNNNNETINNKGTKINTLQKVQCGAKTLGRRSPLNMLRFLLFSLAIFHTVSGFGLGTGPRIFRRIRISDNSINPSRNLLKKTPSTNNVETTRGDFKPSASRRIRSAIARAVERPAIRAAKAIGNSFLESFDAAYGIQERCIPVLGNNNAGAVENIRGGSRPSASRRVRSAIARAVERPAIRAARVVGNTVLETFDAAYGIHDIFRCQLVCRPDHPFEAIELNLQQFYKLDNQFRST